MTDTFDSLRAGFRGPLVMPGDAGYDAARAVWNAMVDKRPSVVARCTGPADIVTAVNFARERGMATAVRGGAHSTAGKGTCEEPGATDANVSWARAFRDALQPFATGGVYVNFLSEEGDERIKAAYGAEKYARLARDKAQYAPRTSSVSIRTSLPQPGRAATPRADCSPKAAARSPAWFAGDLVRWLCPSHNELVIHLRVVSPTDVTTTLVPLLGAEPAVLNLTVLLWAAARNPDGDAVHFDVLHGAANEVIGRLRDLGLEQRGSIVLENVDASISALADRATARRGRFQQFTPVWAEIEARIALDGTFPPSWFALLVIAGLIGAVGILTNSQILIVGAMVVGPEYGAIISLAFGVTRRDSARVLRSAAALVTGFALAVAAALLLSLVIRGAGLEPKAYALGIRPVSDLINTPNWFSFIVAALAGVVGVVSLTEARSSTLIGVFISVTTIPAASDIGVSLAFGSGSEARGSALRSR